MNEMTRTLTFSGVAIVLALLAFVTAPKEVTPDAFLDKGEPFFPEFTDPNVATTLEVIQFDEETASARPFKVTNHNGIWTIPSHHDYPADGKDRLAKTAAGIIAIQKDDFRTSNVSDHEACGVVDPMDENATSLKGRDQRITIRGENDKVLADIILGKELGEREKMRFVRIPGQKRVYAARVDLEISTKFEDWIEDDLLKIERNDIDQVVIKDYSIDERTSSVQQRDEIALDKDGSQWTANGMTPEQEVKTAKVSALLSAVDALKIVGVRAKPKGLSARLEKIDEISQGDVLSLQSKGYYFTRDGQLLSNEGELTVRTTQGLEYALRFGEILYGEGESVTAGTGDAEAQTGPGENRYLFVSAKFLDELFPEPEKPSNMDFEGKSEEDMSDEDHRNRGLASVHKKWEENVEIGRKEASELNDRFASWFYVISADSFDKIHLVRADLIKDKDS